jgi:hypothetical protein
MTTNKLEHLVLDIAIPGATIMLTIAIAVLVLLLL